MASVVTSCKKCKMPHEAITSFLPLQKIKLVFYCKNCRHLNGVIYRFTDKTVIEILGRFQPTHPTNLPYTDLETESAEAASEADSDILV